MSAGRLAGSWSWSLASPPGSRSAARARPADRRRHLRCAVDRLPNAEIRRATADVAVHRGVDIRIGRIGLARQQRRRRHELAGLTVSALRHVELLPRALQRMRPVGREAFDRRDLGARHRRDAALARPDRRAVHLHRARAALGDTAAELRALEVEHVPKHPQQGHVVRDVDRGRLAVDLEGDGHGVRLLAGLSAFRGTAVHYAVVTGGTVSVSPTNASTAGVVDSTRPKSPSQRAMTTVARQLPITLSDVRAMSIRASTPRMTA